MNTASSQVFFSIPLRICARSFKPMHPALNIAKRAALNAGSTTLRYLERLDRIPVSEKRRNDFVSEADIQTEREIIRTLQKFYPDYGVLAEESGRRHGATDEYQWVIDPLDGTTNYLHGIPHYAISIALRHKERLEVAVVYDPIRQEMFTAARGNGAHLNDRRMRVKGLTSPDGALLGTGFPFRHLQYMQSYLAMFHSLSGWCGEIRRAGSAALDLAYVASGRFDGYWEIGLSPWDMAAGALLVQEAGGLVGDFRGGHDFLTNGNIVAGSPKVFKAVLQSIQSHLPSDLMC
jgi:myo-inositol-1(or 4)-monophosphatase